MNKLYHQLTRPVDNAPLIVFRMIFGLLICLEAWGAIATGWVKNSFITPEYTFPFIALDWLRPLPGNGMYFYYGVLGLLGVFVMLGYFYRIAVAGYTVLWTVTYFMQKTHYNNHYYLLILLLCFMLIVPANQYTSLDVRRKPSLKSLTCPQWCLWIFVLQIGIVYFYGAINKIYPDWLELRPISIWFAGKRNYWLIGSLLQEKWLQYIIAYCGILFDLLIVPALLWRKTRTPAFLISIFFHLFNSAVFQVGIFPYLGISWALFFYPPEQIRKLFLRKKPQLQVGENSVHYPTPKWLFAVLAIYFIFQIGMPLRHHLIEGDVFLTEEGHRMSWRMMLRVKSGSVYFEVIDPASGQDWRVRTSAYLKTSKMERQVATKPDFCYQFVQLIKDDFTAKGYPDVEIYAKGWVKLNGHESQPLYDETVDLAKVAWDPWRHATWLVDDISEDE